MTNYYVFHNENGTVDDPQKTDFSYNVDDEITVNEYRNKYKCIEVEEKDGDKYFHFKQGKLVYIYDY